jgi:RNA polymerase sigma-70 factor (ECF subfamily)
LWPANAWNNLPNLFKIIAWTCSNYEVTKKLIGRGFWMSDAETNDGVVGSGLNTSTTLLQLVKNRDEGAWQRLTQLYGPLVYHWCRKSGLSAEDSADMLQDVYRSIVQHIENFEKSAQHGSFRGWLWTITRNRIVDFHRTTTDKARATGGSEMLRQLQNLPDQEPDDQTESGISASDGLTSRALQIIKAEVKESTWLAFWRSTVDEIDPSTVATELGISVESVWQAKSRVLRRLRQLLM